MEQPEKIKCAFCERNCNGGTSASSWPKTMPLTNAVVVWQLKKLGFHADVVANGSQAVDALSIRRYDLVLMDCQMPGMDGLAATRLIREKEKGDRGAAADRCIDCKRHAGRSRALPRSRNGWISFEACRSGSAMGSHSAGAAPCMGRKLRIRYPSSLEWIRPRSLTLFSPDSILPDGWLPEFCAVNRIAFPIFISLHSTFNSCPEMSSKGLLLFRALRSGTFHQFQP